MPGPEQRKKEKKARVDAQLQKNRDIRKAREEAKSNSPKPKASANTNTNNDNTSLPTGFRVPPPVAFTTGHTYHEGKIKIYKDPSSPASRKRKAEDSSDSDESEEDDERKPGHEAKKARPTSDHVPATGKSYRGTGKNSSSPRPSGSVGALGKKSTNASLKSRTQLMKRDKKNLNRNAPKSNVPCGKGTGRPSQSRPTQHLVKPEAMEDVRHRPLQAPKRKSQDDLENETTKKPKISPGTTPPVRELKAGAKTAEHARTTSFFDRNQKPGFTAAIPTAIVQEVVKTTASGKVISRQGPQALIAKHSTSSQQTGKAPPTARSDEKTEDKGLGKPSVKISGQTPLVRHPVDNATTGGNEKSLKRKNDTTFEEGPGTEHKKSRRSPQQAEASVVGRSDPIAEISEAPISRASPRGIANGASACYINSVLQAIANIPEMVYHYRALAGKVIPGVDEFFALNAKKLQGSEGPKSKKDAQKMLKVLLHKNKSKICLGAYLGALLDDLVDVDPFTQPPSSCVFRQACGVLLANDKGEAYDGESQQDCMEFFEKLLHHLEMEDEGARTYGATSVVRDLFGLEAATKFKCLSCDHARESSAKEEMFAFTTGMPRQGASVCITECLDTYANPDRVDVHCNSCGRTRETLKSMALKRLGPYVVVNIDRVVTHGSENPDTVTKNPAHITIPSSGVVTLKNGAEEVQYEAIGTLKHEGLNFTKGHWTSAMKIDGQWFKFDDEKVTIDDPSPRGRSKTSMVVLKKCA